jgi:U2-associated protein SR140
MERELKNPEFAFLFDLRSPEHVYYRWRIYSLAQGELVHSWQNTDIIPVGVPLVDGHRVR